MKTACFLICFIFLFPPIHSQQFHSLDGVEDTQGNTLLIYRLGSEQYHTNPIFKLNAQTGYEQKIMEAHEIYYPIGADIKTVVDFEFFPGDTANFMNIGDIIFMDYGSYIAKNDSLVFGHFSPFDRVDISKQDPQKVFVFGGGSGPVRSWDGGNTFPEDSIPLIANFAPIALSDFDDNIMFGFDEELEFCKNSGVVDTSFVAVDDYFRMFYDVNQFHIYRVNYTYDGYSLNVSNNKGDAFTWTKTYQSENPIYVSIDLAQSGVVYLADGRRIYKSVNNGYSFTEYKALPGKLIGLYKKPNSEILYAASRKYIYKITPDSITIIKSIPVPADEFSFYPLKVGNYWVYTISSWSYPYYYEEMFSREVVGVELQTNNKKYFKIREFYPSSPYVNYVYERIDTSSGKIFRFDSDCPNPDSEKVIEDFNAVPGDSLLLQRFTMCWDSVFSFYEIEDTASIFGANRKLKIFNYNWLQSFRYRLVKDIGIYQIDEGGCFYQASHFLNGCIINGVLYGDTTLTDLDDEGNSIPKEYKLEQNYPNPFNPNTTIKYSIPTSPINPSPYQGEGNRERLITLTVYDVLGRKVAILVNEEKPAGSYEVEFNASQLPSGVYFYRLKAGEYVETKKMLLIK